MSDLKDAAWAKSRGMSDWTIRSLRSLHYYENGVWAPSPDPRGLVWVTDEVSTCTYDDGEDRYCVLTVMDEFKMRPPKCTRPLDATRQYWMQLHDADDGFYERWYPEFPTDDLNYLLNAQPLQYDDVQLVFYPEDLDKYCRRQQRLADKSRSKRR